MEKAKPVGIWIRVSTEDQARGESPEHHEKRASYYAESKGWNVREVYHLEAVSGKSVMDHPEAKRMLKDIKNGHITGLIFSKLARLARNTRELLDFSEIFREYNADLISLQESIDTSTPAGRLFYTMIAAMAQWEREEISERVAASVPIRAKLGKPTGGQASFGYQWVDKKLIPQPTEAPVRKLIYELFSEHQRKKTVARILNERGYRTRNGSKFSDTTIERLLQDSTAKGLFKANYTKSLGDNKKWILKPQDEWVYTEVDPVVSEELWNTCNHILDEQEKKNKRPTRKAVHLFTGFVFCTCNSKMYVPSNNPKYTCYTCKNKIGTQDLEDIFHHQLKNFFFSSTDIAGYLNSADQMIKEKEELVRTLFDEKRKVEKEMEKIYKSYIEDEIDSKTFGSLYRPKEGRVRQIDDQIPELQGEIDFLKIRYLSSDQILNEAKDLYSRWPELTLTEKRRIIENITDTITIGTDDIAINLCYLPHTPSSASASSELIASGQRNFRDSWLPPA
jgi:site-specific DNA recombinase